MKKKRTTSRPTGNSRIRKKKKISNGRELLSRFVSLGTQEKIMVFAYESVIDQNGCSKCRSIADARFEILRIVRKKLSLALGDTVMSVIYKQKKIFDQAVEELTSEVINRINKRNIKWAPSYIDARVDKHFRLKRPESINIDGNNSTVPGHAADLGWSDLRKR